MAVKRNIPVGDIASNPILRAAYEKALAEQPIVSDFKKSAVSSDEKGMTALKDLSAAVKRQDKTNVELSKYLKRIDKNTDRSSSGLDDVKSTLTELLSEIKKLSSDEKKARKATENAEEDKQETKEVEKKSGSGFLSTLAEAIPLIGGFGAALRSVAAVAGTVTAGLSLLSGGLGKVAAGLGFAAGVKINQWIKENASDKIDSKLSPLKRSLGFTQENFGGMTEHIRSWYGTGIPKMLGGKSLQEFEKSHNLAPRDGQKAEVSSSVKELQNKSILDRMLPKTETPSVTEEQRKQGYIDINDPNVGRRATPYGSSAGMGEQFSSGGEIPKNGWWTSERQKYAVDYLMKNGGFTQYGASAAVARMTKEAPRGPGDSNNIGGGHWGIAQWGVNRRGREMAGASFEEQLAWYVQETRSSESAAGQRFRTAKNAQEGAYAAASFERAEGWKESGGRTDVLMNRTPIDAVYKSAFGGTGPAAAPVASAAASSTATTPSSTGNASKISSTSATTPTSTTSPTTPAGAKVETNSSSGSVQSLVSKWAGASRGESEQCVALVKEAAGVGHTSSWKPGPAPSAATPVGTPIATFGSGGKYENIPGRSHAAIFLGMNQDGSIRVLDQWKGHAASERTIRPGTGPEGAENFRIIVDDKGNAKGMATAGGAAPGGAAIGSTATPGAPAGGTEGATSGGSLGPNTILSAMMGEARQAAEVLKNFGYGGGALQQQIGMMSQAMGAMTPTAEAITPQVAGANVPLPPRRPASFVTPTPTESAPARQRTNPVPDNVSPTNYTSPFGMGNEPLSADIPKAFGQILDQVFGRSMKHMIETHR